MSTGYYDEKKGNKYVKRGKNFVGNLKGIVLILLGACLLFFVIANLIPLNRKVSGEYTATLLSLSKQEQTGTALISFSGTYKQYLLNIVFQDRFEGAFYVEGNPLERSNREIRCNRAI